MAILIKGMEMPETCDECDFHIYHSDGEYVCVATPLLYPWNLANYKGGRKDFCPLVEVPDEQPEREFIKLTVRDSNGRPYYSIIYLEVDKNGIGHDFEGYSSYSLDVISDYLKRYFWFMSSAQPEKRTDKRTETHACDLIKRQDAIDIVVFECGKWTGLAKEISKQLRQLPSAQPDVIRCKDCKWYGRADKRRFYRGMDCLQKRIDTIVPDKDFCSRAERRIDDKTNKGSSC